ncbi:M16 family metallopeptidase [Clostridium kluyveri]|uniref:Peptidase M16 n=1 Tax=Clostridium kluyveri TaxID=1534 RepID=A0A1L5FC62_CLOKL|nr:pitrilysin family protein [Clostridium kluyveri]APM40599.1 peptidase M16 [Clostridium kluyveri]UZQ49279.1 insulinase family protein [Clostridium kluyveri]
MFDARQRVLPNGIKLITIKKDTKLAAFHAAVNIGAMYESNNERGISHFIEHMLFKGTMSRNNKKLNIDLETLGGEYNAYTDNTSTVYSVTSLREELEKSVDIISDMLMNSIFPQEEIEKEREVILSEIRSSKDDIEDYSFDRINKIAFKKSALRYNVAGNEKDISKFTREDLVGFYSKYYVPNNCYISIVSPYEHEKVYQLIYKYFNKWKSKEVKHNDIIFEYNTPRKKISSKKDIEQSTILYLFTFNGLSEKQELALRILNHKFGGSNNSILFTKLREERGLAYDVYTDLDLDEGVKTLYVYTSVGEENLKTAVGVIEDCIDKVKNGDIIFKDDMVSLMKKVLKTAVAFTLEDPTDIGNYVLHQSIKGEDIYKLINDIEKIETIKKEDIYEVAKIVFNNPTIHILKRG